MAYLTKHRIPTTVVVKQGRMTSQEAFEIKPVTHHTGCMNRCNKSGEPDWVPTRSVNLLNQVRERVRYLHDSLQTEKAYVYSAKAFVLSVARSQGGFRHPREMERCVTRLHA